MVGGAVKNDTGHITRAKGLQSVIQLMGEKDLFDYWSETYKTHTMDWSPEKAADILSEWREKFEREVEAIMDEENLRGKYSIDSFSDSQMENILERNSEISCPALSIGFVCMVRRAFFNRSWIRAA